MPEPFDVVIVPDFSGPQAGIFEQRTLLFLASWIVNAGNAVNFPLHVACIGEPPSTVKKLAEICNASVTVHEPLKISNSAYCNKLRGLEVTGKTEKVLLLDADIVVLADPSGLSDMNDCIAASPASWCRIPEEYWHKICQSLEILQSPSLVPTISQRFVITRPRTSAFPVKDFQTSIISYFNSGVIMVPWKYGLRDFWERNITRISGIFNETDIYWQEIKHFIDQIGLSTVISFYQKKECCFFQLPDAYNSQPLYLFAGALRAQDIKLFHAFHLFRKPSRITKQMTLYKYDLLRQYARLYRANRKRNKKIFNKKKAVFVVKEILNLDKKLRFVQKKAAGFLKEC